MFDLEQAIAEWREQMAAAGIKTPVPLEELESHLRDDYRALVAAGTPQFQAFQLAVSRVGSPRSVANEFRKDYETAPVRIGAWLWSGMALIVAGILWTKWHDGRFSLLLSAHVFSLTVGYLTAFFAGVFGIYTVCRQFGREFSGDAFARAIFRFNQLAAGFVAVGLLLGMVWNKQNHGQWLTGNSREMGTLVVILWLAASVLVQRISRMGSRSAILLSLAGNITVSLAWFGAGVAGSGHRIASCWPLDALLCVCFFFLVVATASPSRPAEA